MSGVMSLNGRKRMGREKERKENLVFNLGILIKFLQYF
jgi:hypothetical protein